MESPLGSPLCFRVAASRSDLTALDCDWLDWDWLAWWRWWPRWKLCKVSVVELTTLEATDWALERRLEAAAETLEATLAAA